MRSPSRTTSITDDERTRTRKVAQRRQRAFALVFLVNGDGSDDQHRRTENERLVDVAQRKVDRRAGHEQQQDRLANDAQHNRAPVARAGPRNFVIAFRREPALRLGMGEPRRLALRGDAWNL
jgi:hypothetical protein